MSHYSVSSWMSALGWDKYLRGVEDILNDRLVRLDDNDPVRRKSSTDSGSFIITFGEREASRWLRGRFEKTRIELEIQHYKSGTDSFGRRRENILTFYIPGKFNIVPNVVRLIQLFRLNNELHSAFYGYADYRGIICAKRPSTPSLDLSRELLGMFWLTYFGARYCAYFKRERLMTYRGASVGPADGITFQLADAVQNIQNDERRSLESSIGSHSFAGGGEEKEVGQYALSLDQLV